MESRLKRGKKYLQKARFYFKRSVLQSTTVAGMITFFGGDANTDWVSCLHSPHWAFAVQICWWRAKEAPESKQIHTEWKAVAQRRRGKCHVAIIFLGFGRSQQQTWRSTFQVVKKSDCTQNAIVSYRRSYVSSGEMEVYDNVQSVKLQERRISELGVELCTAWSQCECSAGRSEPRILLLESHQHPRCAFYKPNQFTLKQLNNVISFI